MTHSTKPGVGKPPSSAGAGDPERFRDVLAEMEDFFLSEGVPKLYWTAEEITRLPKGQIFDGRRAVAIPPRALWPNMTATLRAFIRIRERLGVPLNLRGYRPPDYNRVVAPNSTHSTHQWFAALDLYAPQSHRVELALAGAQEYLDGDDLGFGAYHKPTPTDIHIDTGKRKRYWREAKYYIDKLEVSK